MRNRHLLVGIAGVLLVVVGLMALWWPVYLDQYDQFGIQVSCGRGFGSGLSPDALAGGDGDHFVERCSTALLIRRVWAIPAAVIGWLILTGFLILWVHHAPKTDEDASPA